MFGLFHKSSDKTVSEKGLSNVIDYTGKSSRDVAHLADNNRISANNLMAYGSHIGDDLTDVTHKLGQLLTEWSNVLMEFSDTMDQYRDTLKSISIKEQALQPSRDQKRKLQESIERLQSSYNSLDKLNALKAQLKELEEFTEVDEVEMANFKRIATREGLYILLNGMHAMASKTDIVSTFGKYIVDELDVAPIQPHQTRPEYQGAEKTKRIQEDALRAIEMWKPDQAKVRRTLTSHHGKNPLLVKRVDSVAPTPPPKDIQTEGEAVEIPDRIGSLENPEHSYYKPDEMEQPLVEEAEELPEEAVDQEEKKDQENEDNQYQPPSEPMMPHPSVLLSPAANTALSNTGMSPMTANNALHPPHPYYYQHQPAFNQHNLYQFYQHYLPPRSYEEMSSTLSPVFRGSSHLEDEAPSSHHQDAGGFVLPSDNPNYYLHGNNSRRPSATSSVRSNPASHHEEET
ncbi:Sphingolipid long chain base-responsive protein LSP1 [Choanephora cucurbitarum]|uniref:Sphingolipid long chain base-responsive protein LSP1 n=1 Tax=Choanephora cucurbitarum TaxID=101091 RepID=A0A1C7NFC6_9FUNG|nr:Sphingolipid long chain base-responsive protein LSP1 [Choanephora cucurbitarum]